MKKIISCIITVFVCTSLMPYVTHADAMSFNVKALLPTNQNNPDVSYFDLRLKPAAKQKIAIDMSNNTAKAITLKTVVNTASTNSNGIIDYSASKVKQDKSMKVAIAELVTGPTEITLNANETKTVSYQIKMPQESFDGVLLGGFYIAKKQDEQTNETEVKQQIKNEFSYVIGLKINNTDKKITPNLELNAIETTEKNDKTLIAATLRNTQGAIISGLKIEAKLTKKGSKKTIVTLKKEQLGMAPNSAFSLPIDLENRALSKGDYTLTIAASDKTNNKWQLSKDFTVSQAITVHEEQTTTPKQAFPWALAISIGIIVIALIVVLLLVIVRKNKRN